MFGTNSLTFEFDTMEQHVLDIAMIIEVTTKKVLQL